MQGAVVSMACICLKVPPSVCPVHTLLASLQLGMLPPDTPLAGMGSWWPGLLPGIASGQNGTVGLGWYPLDGPLDQARPWMQGSPGWTASGHNPSLGLMAPEAAIPRVVNNLCHPVSGQPASLGTFYGRSRSTVPPGWVPSSGAVQIGVAG